MSSCMNRLWTVTNVAFSKIAVTLEEAVWYMWQLQKILGQGVYLKSGGMEKPFDAVAFRPLTLSSYTHLPVFVQFLKTFLEDMCDLLQHNVWRHLNPCCVLKVMDLPALHLQKSHVAKLREYGTMLGKLLPNSDRCAGTLSYRRTWSLTAHISGHFCLHRWVSSSLYLALLIVMCPGIEFVVHKTSNITFPFGILPELHGCWQWWQLPHGGLLHGLEIIQEALVFVREIPYCYLLCWWLHHWSSLWSLLCYFVSILGTVFWWTWHIFRSLLKTVWQLLTEILTLSAIIS